MSCRNPVYRSFYLSSGKAAATSGFRIVSYMYFCNLSIFIFLVIYTFYKICIHQTHFIAWKQTEIFFWRFLHKIRFLNIQNLWKRHLSCTQSFIFLIVHHVKILYLIFRIIVNYKLYRFKHSHHSGTFEFQVFSNTIFQHGIIHGTVALWNTTQLYKHANGFGRKASASQCI